MDITHVPSNTFTGNSNLVENRYRYNGEPPPPVNVPACVKETKPSRASDTDDDEILRDVAATSQTHDEIGGQLDCLASSIEDDDEGPLSDTETPKELHKKNKKEDAEPPRTPTFGVVVSGFSTVLPILDTVSGQLGEHRPNLENPLLGEAKKMDDGTPKRRILQRHATITFDRDRSEHVPLLTEFNSLEDIIRRQMTLLT